MGKVKSVICLILMTILIAGLCLVCTLSFEMPNSNNYYNSVLSMMDKDAGLGNVLIDGDHTVGGAYTAVYYPEGVISSEEYTKNLGAFTDEQEKKDYEDRYQASEEGSVYFEREIVLDEEGKVSESFSASFGKAVASMKERFGLSRIDGLEMKVADGYTIRVTVPAMESAAFFLLDAFSYTGEFTVSYGSELHTATKIMPRTEKETINDYIKGSHSQTVNGTSYVVIDFTEKGRQALYDASASSTTVFFQVGENQVIGLTVSEQINEPTLYISGYYTDATASAVSILINDALNGESTDLSFTVGGVYRADGYFGGSALTALYIAFGVCFVLMAAFFFIRYHLLGFAHLYAFLIYLIAMVLCLYYIPFLYLSVGVFIAVMLVGALLSVSNAIAYEYARKEYALGKTMTSSVKTGYKKCFWHIFDLHIALAVFGFLVYFIAVTELSTFGFVLGLGTVFAGLCTLAVNRFCWAIMMELGKDKGKFCNFKREEAEIDE